MNVLALTLRQVTGTRRDGRKHGWARSAALGLLLLLSACSGLGGEPQIVATFIVPTDAPESALPAQHPDLAQGQAIFAENCTRCHGANGAGDGQFALTGQLTVLPPDFTDPERTRTQIAAEWFDVVTHGRIENLMPPWVDSLSEAERWSVTFFAYTRSYQPDQLANGAAIWAERCAACHGDTGAGDGPQAADYDTLTDLTQPGALVEQSDEVLFSRLSGGEDDPIHPFAAALDETQRWDVIAFTRTLALENADVLGQPLAQPITTPEANSEATVAPNLTPDATESVVEVRGVVRGQVSNGTGDGTLPAGLTVTLRVFDSQLNQETFETTVADDGSFIFEDAPIRADNVYIATTTYADRIYNSDMRSGNTTEAELDLPITIFETTQDSSVVSISSFLVQISGAGNGLQVAQLLTFSNNSDRVFSLDETLEGNRHPSVTIPIPAGAQNLNTADETNRYVVSEDGTTLTDTQPLFPGEDHIIHVIYTLPYSGSARFELPMRYSVEGPVRVLMQPESLQLTSSQLSLLGPQAMGNTTFSTYGTDLPLPAGQTIAFDVSGASATAAGTAAAAPNLLPYVLIAAGSISILVAAILFYLGRRMPAAAPAPTAPDQAMKQMLIDEIAALDDLHEQGKIEEKAYSRRREQLKQRLSEHVRKNE